MNEYGYLVEILRGNFELSSLPVEIYGKRYYNKNYNGYNLLDIDKRKVLLDKLPEELRVLEVYLEFLEHHSEYAHEVPVEFRTNEWYLKLLDKNLSYFCKDYSSIIPIEYKNQQIIEKFIRRDPKNLIYVLNLYKEKLIEFSEEIKEFLRTYYETKFTFKSVHDYEEYNNFFQSAQLLKDIGIDVNKITKTYIKKGGYYSPITDACFDEQMEKYIFENRQYNNLYIYSEPCIKRNINTILKNGDYNILPEKYITPDMKHEISEYNRIKQKYNF